jgi:branched-chain amino acid transport system permease protein
MTQSTPAPCPPVKRRGSRFGRLAGQAFLVLALAVALWKLGGGLLENPTLFAQQVVGGLGLGFVYALIALGYTMVYGIVRLINFAHGDVFMVGAFISLFAIRDWKIHKLPGQVFPALEGAAGEIIGTVLVLLLSALVCMALAVVIERVAYKPIREAPRINALITAIGVSFFLEYAGALKFVFGTDYNTYTRPFEATFWDVAGVRISNITIVIIVISSVMLVSLQYIVRRTKLGKAMRSVAADKQTARLMGINVDSVITFTFGLGGFLAGIGGVLYAIAYPQVWVFMGIMPGLKAFVAAVLGGIGNIPGAFVGALIMGQAEVLSAAYISTPMRDAIAFAILIIVLLIKPTGIFGEKQGEKA